MQTISLWHHLSFLGNFSLLVYYLFFYYSNRLCGTGTRCDRGNVCSGTLVGYKVRHHLLLENGVLFGMILLHMMFRWWKQLDPQWVTPAVRPVVLKNPFSSMVRSSDMGCTYHTEHVPIANSEISKKCTDTRWIIGWWCFEGVARDDLINVLKWWFKLCLAVWFSQVNWWWNNTRTYFSVLYHSWNAMLCWGTIIKCILDTAVHSFGFH